jgi:hypothetical protein
MPMPVNGWRWPAAAASAATALAELAILDGLTPEEALRWVRRTYHPRAVETRWQQRWLRSVR